MKRILFACILATATFTIGSVQRVSAQSLTHVSAADFTTQANLLDTYIGAGNMTAAQSTWDTVHHMMMEILSYTKNSIMTAATPADKASYTTIMNNQRNIYKTIWALKPDLVTNRAAIHTNLGLFDATIY